MAYNTKQPSKLGITPAAVYYGLDLLKAKYNILKLAESFLVFKQETKLEMSIVKFKF